jgi:hypothetical protein
MALEKFPMVFVGNDNVPVNVNQTKNSFVPSSSLTVSGEGSQVIFATDFEHDFYTTLTNCKIEYR